MKTKNFNGYQNIVGKNVGRYRKAIVFIEEPEAHLHPDNQVKLIEKFAMAISGDLKIIVSSHSNYIFNKLNNMILARVITKSQYSPMFMYKDQGVTLSKEMPMDDLGASDINFSATSENLLEEREDIIASLMEQYKW